MFQCKLLDLKSDTFLNGPLKNPLEVGYLQSYLLDFTSNNFMHQHATEIAMLPEWHYHGLALDTSEPGYTGISSATSHHLVLLMHNLEETSGRKMRLNLFRIHFVHIK